MFLSLLKIGLLVLTPLSANVVSEGAPSSAVNDGAPSISKLNDSFIDIGDYHIYSFQDIGYTIDSGIAFSTINININDIAFYFTDSNNANLHSWQSCPYLNTITFEYGGPVVKKAYFKINNIIWASYDYDASENRLDTEQWGVGLQNDGYDTCYPGVFAVKSSINLSLPFLKSSYVDFTFENQINRYGPVGIKDDNSVSNMVLAEYGTKHIFSGLFYDDLGYVYKGINVIYINSNYAQYVDYSTDTPTYHKEDGNNNPGSPSLIYMYMEYVRLNDTTVMVNQQDSILHNGEYYRTNTSSWVSQSFRSIHIISDEYIYSGLPTNSYSGMERLQTFNSGYSRYGTMVGGISNVTSIIYTGLSGLTGLFGLAILPGISIGLLLFLPLIFSLLLFILKLFKR